MSRRDEVALLSDMVLASAAAAAGTFDPTVGVAAAGAAVGIAGRIRIALQKSAERNLEAAADGVCSEGIDLTSAFDALLRTPEGIALVADSLRSIAIASFEEKARAIGTCVGRAAIMTTDAAIESEAAWVRLINLLQKPHVLALLAFDEPTYEEIDDSILGARKANREAREFATTSAFVDSLKVFDSLTRESVRADLVSWGLVKMFYGEQIGLHGGALDSDTFWRRTSHGTDVARRLRADTGSRPLAEDRD